jgi:hypothetical protein
MTGNMFIFTKEKGKLLGNFRKTSMYSVSAILNSEMDGQNRLNMA